MIRTNNSGAITVKFIDPKTLDNMKDNEIVIVNRVQISSKIVECEIKNVSSENVTLLKHAFKDMKIKEKESKNIVIGAEMLVKDIRIAFPEYKSWSIGSLLLSYK